MVKRYENLFPSEYRTYIEPFVGSGAVFFHLNPEAAILSDKNKELINSYHAIKKDWRLVYAHLKNHNKNHSKDYYYKIRGSKPRSEFTKAARLIYLNRTCWNGLYRVNCKGEFNVPIGTKTNVILDTDNFHLISVTLSNTELLSDDFQNVIDKAQTDDFLFVDPPYTVKHKNNGFLKYNETLFSWEDQVRLKESLLQANSRKAKILLTNANHKSIINLYKNYFNIRTLTRKSIIAGQPRFRNNCEELVATNY
ncbi:DNA adenine methylase [Desulfosudis oleivorans Hxd3]|uniref:site-specific DNA-methyltransferase (adenine-specific) n=1 Tax=Desulfosudis oleivorans (strain DSM 6200 / JCM 39069 / Hxd3) TaxID=96561 RepID=A8ZVS2_DESOH|nr:DNA adenine methylase [Desulfosudis oleivorans Hxd3]